MNKRRIYVVDDEEPIRRSTRLMLTVKGFEVAVFESGQAFVEVADALKPGAVLLDIRMPGLDGLDVQRSLNARGIAFPVIVMTGHGDVAIALAALQAGAVAFLEKPFSRSAIDGALDAAFRRLEDPAGSEGARAAARTMVAGLAEPERRVLAGLAQGLSIEALANAIGSSPQSVEARRAKLFAELGIDSLADALTLAFTAGLGAADED